MSSCTERSRPRAVVHALHRLQHVQPAPRVARRFEAVDRVVDRPTRPEDGPSCRPEMGGGHRALGGDVTVCIVCRKKVLAVYTVCTYVRGGVEVFIPTKREAGTRGTRRAARLLGRVLCGQLADAAPHVTATTACILQRSYSCM